MLIASIGNKCHTLNLREDEITSIALGPLSYMPLIDIWQFFQDWLSPFCTCLWPKTMPTNVNLSFWPNLKKQGRVEPDLVVRFSDNGITVLTLLIEAKWSSLISGRDQLIKQWKSLSEKEKESVIHVYLVKDIGRGERDIERSLSIYSAHSWKSRLICVSWRSLVGVLQKNLAYFQFPMNRWAEGVISFLRLKGQISYNGFQSIGNDLLVMSSNKEIFWKIDSWFLSTMKVNYDRSYEVFWKGESRLSINF
jgi:hypothetical protein